MLYQGIEKEIRYKFFEREMLADSKNLIAVRELAQNVIKVLGRPDIRSAIQKVHKVGATSHAVQGTILHEMEDLGFSSERKGLFSNFKVSGIRPDYYSSIGGGILFEVERGKTIANNMDILDVWKTHICKEARHLFLLVPEVRATEKGSEQRIFNTVENRIAAFFGNDVKPIDVDSVHLFGY
jgi:hypothetical protein